MSTSTAIRILIVDDDRAFRVATESLLRDEGYAVASVSGAREALERLAGESFDLILSDLVMEGMNGVEFLQQVRRKMPEVTVIMVTGFGSIGTAVDAMRLGAYDYLTKPCNNDELIIKIGRAADDYRKTIELRHLRALLSSEADFSNIFSRNEKMQQLFKLVRQVSDTDVTVLIQGETGTGKELIAKAIHFNSQRRNLPFIPFQCSAIPETLIESELFGFERGTFSGATRLRIGKFEEAGGGSIFLDEIGDVPLAVQTKLLRVLQERQIMRLGSNITIPVDVRVIAATNRSLDAMIAAGTFRSDLLYRLNVFPITVPPLRERLDDIPLLAEHFLKKHASLSRHEVREFAPSVIHDMMNYHWPGNVREMENLIKRAIIKTEGDTVTAIELRPDAATEPPSPLSASMPYKEYLDRIVADAEQKYLLRMLKECDGNLNQVARVMDIDRKTVYRKIEEFKIDVSLFKK
jgi:DNA-binding NtrC family response regulator